MRRRHLLRTTALACSGLALVPLPMAIAAVTPDERLSDPALEARARELGKELRCLVCQNQSIDDSDADLARDLRAVVRERLSAGDSDAQVMEYVTARYGDFVLLRPPVRGSTWLLWFGPVGVLALGALALVLRGRHRAKPVAAPLSADEKAAVDKLLHAEAGQTER